VWIAPGGMTAQTGALEAGGRAACEAETARFVGEAEKGWMEGFAGVGHGIVGEEVDDW